MKLGGGRWDTITVYGLMALYVFARVTIAVRAPAWPTVDSGSYGPRGGVTIETLSFTGAAPRPWGVPLLYTLVPSDTGRVIVQQVVGTAAWLVLAYAVAGWLTSRVARVLAVALLLTLALMHQVYTWDYAILSESLSVNLGLASFGLFALWLRNGSRTAFALMLVSAFWWTFTRQDILPLVGLLIAGLAVVAWRRRDRRLTAAVAAGVLVVGVAWHVVLLPRIDVGYAQWGAHLRLSESTFLYRLRVVILPDPREKSVYVNRYGMPDCPGLDRIAERRSWSMGAFDAAYVKCPAMRAWVRANGQSSGYRYMFDEPRHFLHTMRQSMPLMLSGDARYAPPVTVLPGRVDAAYTPRADAVLPLAVGLEAVALAVVVAAGGWRRLGWLVTAALALGVVAVAEAVVQQMYSVGEYQRFGMQEAILLRVSVLVVVACAVDAVAVRIGRDPTAWPAALAGRARVRSTED